MHQFVLFVCEAQMQGSFNRARVCCAIQRLCPSCHTRNMEEENWPLKQEQLYRLQKYRQIICERLESVLDNDKIKKLHRAGCLTRYQRTRLSAPIAYNGDIADGQPLLLANSRCLFLNYMGHKSVAVHEKFVQILGAEDQELRLLLELNTGNDFLLLRYLISFTVYGFVTHLTEKKLPSFTNL